MLTDKDARNKNHRLCWRIIAQNGSHLKAADLSRTNNGTLALMTPLTTAFLHLRISLLYSLNKKTNVFHVKLIPKLWRTVSRETRFCSHA